MEELLCRDQADGALAGPLSSVRTRFILGYRVSWSGVVSFRLGKGAGPDRSRRERSGPRLTVWSVQCADLGRRERPWVDVDVGHGAGEGKVRAGGRCTVDAAADGQG